MTTEQDRPLEPGTTIANCIVMEFLDGASLSTLLEKGIDRVNAIRVALAVAEAPGGRAPGRRLRPV